MIGCIFNGGLHLRLPILQYEGRNGITDRKFSNGINKPSVVAQAKVSIHFFII